MKIGVYGLGRFGTFWAELLAEHFEVIAYNRTPRESIPNGIRLCMKEELYQVDVLFLCVAISSVKDVLEDIAGKLKDGCTVLDTCSVKVYPARLMESILPERISCIATHPMFGPDSGRNGIEGLPIVYAPLRCPDAAASFWYSAFSDLFKMNVIEMSPEEHDREAAFTQGITHFIGRVLGELSLLPSEIGTAGYKSLLEIVEQTCNDPMQLFYDLQRYNPFTHEMHLKLKESIDDVMRRLDEADSPEQY